MPPKAREALPGRGLFAMTWRGVPPPGGGGYRGRDTMVSLPILTPLPFLCSRRPSVARLKTRGPQGRLVLQGYTLDRSGAFRSGTPPPCTGWPRTVMRGAKEGLGESRGGKGPIWCPCPLLSPLYRRNRLPSAEEKRGAFAALRRNILHCAAGFDMMKIPERGRII